LSLRWLHFSGLVLPPLLTGGVSAVLCRFVFRIGMPPRVRIELVSKMADIEHRLAYGTNDRLQLGALCGAFAGELWS
jgi:replication factor C subunit 3/5